MGNQGGYTVVGRPGLPRSWGVLTPAGRVVAIAYTPTEAQQIADHLGAARPSAPVEMEGLPTDQLIDSLETLSALRAVCKALRDSLAQQPAPYAAGIKEGRS